MALSLDIVRQFHTGGPAATWANLFERAWDICAPPLEPGNARKVVLRRDREIGDIDLILATSGWDLWQTYQADAPSTARELIAWWKAQPAGCAVLILDALSLREAPWIVHGAIERGYNVKARATGAELPADTTPFAKALGFAQRSSLDNNGAGSAHYLDGARTESLGVPWEDTLVHVDAAPRWVMWHHWPDSRLHDLGAHGPGLNALVDEAAKELRSSGFWALVERLTTGRRLVITSDHGYASTGHFPDVTETDQAQHMKDRFRAGRSTPDDGSQSPWVPPIDFALDTPTGRYRFALGRRKWKTAGGYPTLSHGGLSVLEVAVPFIEISQG